MYVCSPLFMSSISDQHKIHRHSQEHSLEHNFSGGMHERPVIHHDGMIVASTSTSVQFPCGVSPASVEAAVRAAPSPSIPHKSRGRTSTKTSWGSGNETSSSLGSPHQPYKGGLTPFSSFKSVPTNEADYQQWRKSQSSSRRSQRPSSTASNHALHPQVILFY